jgi:uncharacterized protein
MVDTTFLGKGLKFPFQFTQGTGGTLDSVSTTISEGVEHISQAIVQIIKTRIGERVMRRSFGSNLGDLVFEPNDPAIIAEILDEIKTAIRLYEPRVILPVNGLKIVGGSKETGRVEIQVKFTIIGSNVEGNFVYPFYLQTPGGGVNPTGLISSQS